MSPKAKVKRVRAKARPKARPSSKKVKARVTLKARSKAKAKVRPKAKATVKAKVRTKAKATPTRQQLAATIARLCAAARVTGIVMPIDEIQLGVELSEQPRRAVIPSLLALSQDANMHARRVAFGALRRMKAWNDPRVFDVFLRGMSDPKGWVRYDAAWALGDSRTTDPRAIAALEALARGARPDPDLSDAKARAASQAAESLASLRQIS
jgi:hypothetical protein